MKNTTKTLSALALGATIIVTGGTTIYADQNPEATNQFIPSFVQEQQDSSEEIAAEKIESQKLAPLAKITVDQAKQVAEAQVSGTASDVELDNENGSLVYEVKIGNQEVKVDADNGSVLKIEQDDNEKEDIESEDDGINHQFEGDEEHAD